MGSAIQLSTDQAEFLAAASVATSQAAIRLLVGWNATQRGQAAVILDVRDGGRRLLCATTLRLVAAACRGLEVMAHARGIDLLRDEPGEVPGNPQRADVGVAHAFAELLLELKRADPTVDLTALPPVPQLIITQTPDGRIGFTSLVTGPERAIAARLIKEGLL